MDRLLDQAMALSQEKTEDEIEYTFFAELTDLESQLQKASSSETHHQFERRILDQNAKEIARFRSRSIDEGDYYELTIKRRGKDEQGNHYDIESTLGSTVDVHEVIRAIADRRFHKIRYKFPFSVERNERTTELVWEVDVFVLPNGSFDPMVKVDLEVPDMNLAQPSFPLQTSRLMNAKNLTETQASEIARFWQRVQHPM